MYMTANVLQETDDGFLVGNELTGEEYIVFWNDPGRFTTGDRIGVTYDGRMTKSAPPQLTATAITSLSPAFPGGGLGNLVSGLAATSFEGMPDFEAPPRFMSPGQRPPGSNQRHPGSNQRPPANTPQRPPANRPRPPANQPPPPPVILPRPPVSMPLFSEVQGTVIQKGRNFITVVGTRDRRQYRVEYPYAHHFCLGQQVTVRYNGISWGNPARVSATDVAPVCALMGGSG